MSKTARAHVVISGRVQGVFFRAETQSAAQSRGIYGWVRNKADGTVEAVVEGPRTQVDAFLQWCRRGSPMARVDKVDIQWEPYVGDFSSFEIRY